MTQLQYQNPSSVDAVLDSVLISAGPPEVRREILVIGDATGAIVALSSGRLPVDGSGVTQPVSIAASVTVIQPTAANLNATVVFGAPQHVIVDSATLGTVSENLAQWAGTVLGTPTNFGTTPGAVIAGSVNASLFSGTTGLTNTGSALDVNIKTSSINIGVTQQTTPWLVAGQLTNNNAVPGANNIGALSVLANANPPTWTEGDLVLASADLAGGLRTIGGLNSVQSATWNSATAQGTQITVPCAGYGVVVLSIVTDGGTFTAGTISFASVSAGGSRGSIVGMREQGGNPQRYDATASHDLTVGSGSVVVYNYWFPTNGLDNCQFVLATAITGTGNVTVRSRAQAGFANGPTTVGQNTAAFLQATATQGPPIAVASAWPIKVTDGVNTAAVKTGGQFAVTSDSGLVTVLNPATGFPGLAPRSVQSANAVSSGSVASLAIPYSSNVLSGSTLIVVCAVGNNTQPTITDTLGNSYIRVTGAANAAAFRTDIFYAPSGTAGANTVTVNNGGAAASIAAEIYEVVGLAPFFGTVIDESNAATGTGTTLDAGVVNPHSPNGFAVAGFAVGTAAQTIALTRLNPSYTGWLNNSGTLNPTTPAGLFSFMAASAIVGSMETNHVTGTIVSEPWAACIASFKGSMVSVGGQFTITDGSNVIVAVKPASTAAVVADPSLVIAFSPNSPLPTGANVIGALTANQSVNLNQVGAAAITLGAKTSVNSIPVVLASDEATLNVSVQNATLAVTQSTSPWVVQDASAEASLVTIASQVSSSLANLDTQNNILRELRAMRLAMTAIATDGGRYKESDFDPSLFTSELF